MKRNAFISLLLALAMLLSMTAPSVFAADTEFPLSNADFESGDSTGWVLSGYSSVSTDSYAANNTTNTLSLWLSDDADTAGSASYTAQLSAGTYYFTFRMAGAAMDSGLKYSVTSGDATLAAGTESCATTGWDAWQTFTTDSFTLDAAASVTFTLSGTQPAGYWGNLDDLQLFGSGSVALPQISISNGDFESADASGWVLSGYGTVGADSGASNNTTNTLSLWLSDDAEAAGSASYTLELTAGTYYFTFRLAGAAMDSGLKYSVSSGDSVLVSAGESCATTGWDAWQTFTTDRFTLDAAASVTFTLSGTQPAGYWGNLDDLQLYGSGEPAVKDPEPVEADIYVPYLKGTDGDFIRGLDVSSLLSILNSGASFKDYAGNTLDGQGFFDLLAESGTNWIRLRVWNDPFDAEGNGYGGGNNDLEAAKTMGVWASKAGMKVLIDFHYSDFWADPGKQKAPKAWADYSVEEKAAAIKEYTYNSLNTLLAAGVDVGMVQVGNETTGAICGESAWADRCTLFNAGAAAIRQIGSEYGTDIKVAIHFTNPESGNYSSYAGYLNTYSVDYDVFASSYYPYWHGTLSNLTSVLKAVADTYGKEVMVAETSWAYTLEDGDGHANTVSESGNSTGMDYSFSVQGQADELAAVAKAVTAVGDKGIGLFYWEPAWIPVQVYDGTEETLNENKVLWETYGSGWASSYAGEYDAEDAGQWYGGSAVDNQAMFDFSGSPLDSLKTYLYMQTGTTGFEITVTEVEAPTQTYTVGDALSLPTGITVSYNYGDDAVLTVTWNETDVAAVDMNTPGTYTVNGTLSDGLTTTCTVTVMSANLLENPGFEESDMSMYTISQSYAKRSTEDPYADSYSLHFYSSETVDFTAEQTVTLQPGHYAFSLYGQGGDIGDGAETYAYVTMGDTTLTQSFALTGWAVWAEPVISFDVSVETAVTVGIHVTAGQTGAWGTFDEWYLREDLTAEHSFSQGVCSVCGKTDPDYTAPAEPFALEGANLKLGSDLTMYFYVSAEDLTGTDYTMQITRSYADGSADQVKTVSFSDWEAYSETLYRVGYEGIAAKEMTDTLQVVILGSDGSAVSTLWTDSVRECCLRTMADSESAAQTLMADMLNYGAEAQTYFGYGTADLANSTMTDAQKAYATQSFSPEGITDQRVKGDGYIGSSLSLNTNICLNLYFDDGIVDNSMKAVVSYTDHYGNAQSYEISGDLFVSNGSFKGVQIDTLAAADAESLVTVQVYDGSTPVASASDSVASYAIRVYETNTLYEALLKLTASAYAYFHS